MQNKGVGHRKRLRDKFLAAGLDGFLDYEIVFDKNWKDLDL